LPDVAEDLPVGVGVIWRELGRVVADIWRRSAAFASSGRGVYLTSLSASISRAWVDKVVSDYRLTFRPKGVATRLDTYSAW
jgi:hypothetical protein